MPSNVQTKIKEIQQSLKINLKYTEAILEHTPIGPILPSGYKQVEYIQASGNAYINTNYKPNAHFRFESKYYYAARSTTWPTPFGCRSSNDGSNPGFYIHNMGSSLVIHWNEVEKELLSYTEYKVLILSSVIHEVYSYGTEESVRVFWDRVIHSGFHYICVRDMMYSEDMDRQTNPLTSHRYGLEKLTKAPLNTCLKEFEEKWGSINNNKNLIHFLLKYRWQINWERELNENYFPIEFHLFLSKFESMYNQTYLERFRVPFLEDCWKKDFDITVNDYTHIKAIFERKK